MLKRHRIGKAWGADSGLLDSFLLDEFERRLFCQNKKGDLEEVPWESEWEDKCPERRTPDRRGAPLPNWPMLLEVRKVQRRDSLRCHRCRKLFRNWGRYRDHLPCNELRRRTKVGFADALLKIRKRGACSPVETLFLWTVLRDSLSSAAFKKCASVVRVLDEFLDMGETEEEQNCKYRFLRFALYIRLLSMQRFPLPWKNAGTRLKFEDAQRNFDALSEEGQKSLLKQVVLGRCEFKGLFDMKPKETKVPSEKRWEFLRQTVELSLKDLALCWDRAKYFPFSVSNIVFHRRQYNRFKTRVFRHRYGV